MNLNDIRTVSINRILPQKEGRINIYSSEYKAIEELILNKYFPGFLHELRICISDKEQLEALLIMIICIHNHLFQLPL